jgi:hypothetical protein
MLDDAPSRPDLSSMKALDLYGQAATAGDDEQRRQLLRLVVAEDKNFSYAVKDLAELERRMKGYKAAQDELLNQELEQYRAQIAQEKDPARRDQMLANRIQRLNMLRRYRTVIREAREYLAGLPPGAPLTQSIEFAAIYLVTAQLTIRDWDGVLRDGEWYLQRAPGGTNFASIQLYMRNAIEHKRSVEEGKAKAAADVAGVAPDARWDLCLMGQLYQRHLQYTEAIRLYRACIEVGTSPNKQQPIQGLYDCSLALGDFPAARKSLEQLAVLNPELAKVLRVQYDNMVPADE